MFDRAHTPILAFVRFPHIMVKWRIFPMLCAKRKLTGEIVTAYLASKAQGPFICPDCGDEVILKIGKRTVNHFAHVNPFACLMPKTKVTHTDAAKWRFSWRSKRNPMSAMSCWNARSERIAPMLARKLTECR